MIVYSTQRSSTRGTPRGLFGGKGLTLLNRSSVIQKFEDMKLPMVHILNRLSVYKSTL